MKIGILGHGSIGARHADNLRILGHKILYYDPGDEGTIEREKVLAWADAIVVASPTPEHSSDIQSAIKADKDCFCEKPIADKAAKHLKDVLMVGYNLRFHPCVLKAKEWIADGRLGEIYWGSFICAQYNDKPDYLRDGVTLNWSHEIDLALYLLGPAKLLVSAMSAKDDLVDIILKHDELGCQSVIHLDYLAKPEARGFSVSGSKGVIIANTVNRDIVLIGHDGTPKQAEMYKGSYDDDYFQEMKAFVSRVEGNDTLGCTAAEAIEVLNICLQVKDG